MWRTHTHTHTTLGLIACATRARDLTRVARTYSQFAPERESELICCARAPSSSRYPSRSLFLGPLDSLTRVSLAPPSAPSIVPSLSLSLVRIPECPNPETRIRDRIKRSPPRKCRPFDTVTLSLSSRSSPLFCLSCSMLRSIGLSLSRSRLLAFRPTRVSNSSVHSLSACLPAPLPPHTTFVRYSAYMIRCNYNQVNNCYGRYRRALCAKGWPGEPVTNAARFVRRPAPITLHQRTEEARPSPTIRLQLGISSFWSQRLCQIGRAHV